MTANLKKSMAWSMLLILLGIVALYGGTTSLIVLVPAATLVWYGARPVPRSGRN